MAWLERLLGDQPNFFEIALTQTWHFEHATAEWFALVIHADQRIECRAATAWSKSAWAKTTSDKFLFGLLLLG